ncbi:MAG: hypothetical protein LBR19_10030, partial [Bifidobacteriaceae bacterium]|nr:hypothetical protein [Bifidobacteriaceae bacterium]
MPSVSRAWATRRRISASRSSRALVAADGALGLPSGAAGPLPVDVAGAGVGRDGTVDPSAGRGAAPGITPALGASPARGAEAAGTAGLGLAEAAAPPGAGAAAAGRLEGPAVGV